MQWNKECEIWTKTKEKCWKLTQAQQEAQMYK